MAQGNMKKKVKLPSGAKQKQKNNPKRQTTGPKKGGRAIAPKKNKRIEADKLQKNLARAINSNIQHEVSQIATGAEPRPFNLFEKAKEIQKKK